MSRVETIAGKCYNDVICHAGFTSPLKLRKCEVRGGKRPSSLFIITGWFELVLRLPCQFLFGSLKVRCCQNKRQAPLPANQRTSMQDWSFNHRTGGAGHADDSDDDSDNADDGPHDVSSLLRDIDLSSRQETVDYKPNPWSIAKINARSRDSHTQSAKETAQITVPNPKSNTTPTMGPVEAAFKKQADRAQYTSNGGQRVLVEDATKVCDLIYGWTIKGNAKHADGDPL
ncbi:hypothetical protein EDC04DRAFT_1996785 [Pisolithus marmoratus]|nr:hypothetical protein EDC04DRAFT_1996785 [Pisolithus marmoratus]